MAHESTIPSPRARFLRNLLIYGVVLAFGLAGLETVTRALLLPAWVMTLVVLAAIVATPPVAVGLWRVSRRPPRGAESVQESA